MHLKNGLLAYQKQGKNLSRFFKQKIDSNFLQNLMDSLEKITCHSGQWSASIENIFN